MKNKKLIGIILGSVLGVMSLGLIIYGVFLLNSNKYIFSQALSKTFNNLTSSIDTFDNNFLIKELNKVDKYKVSTNMDINISGIDSDDFDNADLSMIENINNLKLKGDIYKNKNAGYLDFSVTAGEESLNLNALLQDDKFYFKVKDMMDEFNYINMPVSSDIEITSDDIKLLINHLKNSIPKKMQDSDFTKSKVALNIDNQKFNTTKISLTFNEKKLMNIIISFFEEISEDNKAIALLQKFNPDINKEMIQELISEIKQDDSTLSDDDLFTLSMYVNSSNNPLRTEIYIGSSNNPDSIISNSVSIVFDHYNNKSNHKINAIRCMVNDNSFIEYKEEYTTQTEANLNLTVNNFNQNTNLITVTGNKKVSNDSLSLILDVNVSGTKLGTIEYILNTVTKSKEYKMSLNINLSMEGPEATIKMDNTFYLNEDFPNVDVSGAIEYKENNYNDNENEDWSYDDTEDEDIGL